MFLTIFTPTYNRAYCLGNLFHSLESQTCKDFIWLIIDDGSTDNTENMVNSFIIDASFPIVYVRQNNSGKHVAYNKAVELCDTELFFCVDSDDYLTVDAVESIFQENLKNQKKNILGFYYKRVLPNGDNMAKEFPDGVTEVGITDLYHRYGFKGDTAIVLRASLIKGLFFPTFPHEKFVSERVLYNIYNPIAPMIIVNKGIYVSEYLPDGYTRRGKLLRANNPYGTALDYLSESYYSINTLDKAKYYAQFISFCRIFSLDKKKFHSYNTPYFDIRLMGWFLSKHYDSIFAKQKKMVSIPCKSSDSLPE